MTISTTIVACSEHPDDQDSQPVPAPAPKRGLRPKRRSNRRPWLQQNAFHVLCAIARCKSKGGRVTFKKVYSEVALSRERRGECPMSGGTVGNELHRLEDDFGFIRRDPSVGIDLLVEPGEAMQDPLRKEGLQGHDEDDA